MVRKHNIPDNNTIQEELKVLTRSEICKKYKCKLNSLSARIQRCKIPYPKRYDSFNEKYFDKWSPNMAYILGFITADGNIKKKRPYISIELNPKDEHILQEILNEIYPDGKIYRSSKYNKKRNMIYYASSIVLYSQYMKDKLKEYSVFPNKTGKHQINFKIPKKYQRDYVRGFFDGDGSVSIQRGNSYKSTFCCQSGKFLKKLHKMIGSLGRLYLDTQQNLWTISCHHKDSIRLRNYMYYNDCMCLTRKKEKFVCLNQ